MPGLIPNAGPTWETALLLPVPAAESVRPCLPVEATATEVILMAGPRTGTPGISPGQWRTVATFPLA